MDKPLVSVQHLSHRYSSQWVIKDISFDLPERGIYGLLGANGAGKSTTMNIMSGVLKQRSGDVFINNISLSADPIAAKQLMGFLPQQPPLYPDMTVEEYLFNCARLRNISKANLKSSVHAVMEKVSVGHFRHRLLRNLSGGYQQRVGIAQAIIHNPAFIILDEPTNGLDPNQILEIRKLIREIASERVVLLSTHILSEIQAICDTVLMMDKGMLVFSGKSAEFDNYLSPTSVIVRLLQMPPAEELKRIEGVDSVELMQGGEYRLKFGNLKGATERIVQESVRNNWRLEEIYFEKNTLNDVFSALSNHA